jgi:hypothetical protein
MRVPRKMPAFLLCLIVLYVSASGVGCSPRNFLTRRLAADLIAGAEAFKAPQLFWLRSGVISNKEFSSPEMMVVKRRGWVVGNEQKKCPLGVAPPPCWDVLLTPLGVDTMRPLISTALPDAGTIAIQAARREMLGISGISKAGNFADVEFTWHWVSLNQVGAALYDSGVRYRSTVAFRSYDDGWRVVEQSAAASQPLEDALRNAQPAAP